MPSKNINENGAVNEIQTTCAIAMRPSTTLNIKVATDKNQRRFARHFIPIITALLGRKALFYLFCAFRCNLAPRLFLRFDVVVVVTITGDLVTQKSWSAVGSHGQYRPVDGRPAYTLARGFFNAVSPALWWPVFLSFRLIKY
jgi:hypothetical protein